MKLLYVLPALAVLGLFSAAYAETDQQSIDRFEAKIDRLDPATHQKRIDRFEAKIDRLEERIDRFEAKIAELEAQAASYVRSTYSEYRAPAEPQTAKQVEGTPGTPTVTIKADGRLAASDGTAEVPYSSSMTLDVKFVNDYGSNRTLLVDLISSVSYSQSADLALPRGGSETLTFAIPSDGPHTDEDAAKLRLVFADASDLHGAHAIKILRTGEPPETETETETTPSLASVTLDTATSIMTITFDAPIDVDRTNVHRLIMVDGFNQGVRLSGATVTSTADSEILTLELTPDHVDAFGDDSEEPDSPAGRLAELARHKWLNIAEQSVFDTDGNVVGDNSVVPITKPTAE